MFGWKGASIALALALAASGAGAQTQTPNPVMAHFRAYRDALDHNDLATAETEAAAAFDASVTRDGDGGSTAALAINLAQARLSLGKREQAYEPALRGFTIASGGHSNVDPLLARLVLGRAELTPERGRQGADHLHAALAEAERNPEINADTYNAASDLGAWYMGQQLYAEAQAAWDIAKHSADASGDENTFARAESRIGHASAVFVQAMDATTRSQQSPSSSHLGGHANQAFSAADAELAEAQSIVGPFAFSDAGPELTVGQRMYASIDAWRYMLQTFAYSRNIGLVNTHPLDFVVPTTDPRPYCPVHVIAEPKPTFPSGASNRVIPGAAVVRIRLDEAGNRIDTRVAGSAPGQWFADAVEQVAPHWRVERGPNAAPNCRFAPVIYFAFTFFFD